MIMNIKRRYGTSLNSVTTNPFATLLQIITLLIVKDESKIPIVFESIKQNMQTSIARILLAYYVLTNQTIFKILYKAITNEQLDLIPYILKYGLQYTDSEKLIDPEMLFRAYQENIDFRKLEQKQIDFEQLKVFEIIRDKLSNPYIDRLDAWHTYLLYDLDFEKYLKSTKKDIKVHLLDWTLNLVNVSKLTT
jgi:hypothetical protein